MSIVERALYYNEKYHINIRYSTYRELFKAMDLTQRKIKVSQSSKDIDEQCLINGTQKLLLRVLSILSKYMDIVFLDEAGFDNF